MFGANSLGYEPLCSVDWGRYAQKRKVGHDVRSERGGASMTTLITVEPPLVRLLGLPALCPATGGVRPLERKVAGLLALLALDGQKGRSTLAGFLWPDSLESAARTNLRQMVYRLRLLAQQSLLGGQQRLAFLPGVSVDVASLEVAAFAGRDAEVVATTGDLLAGHDYDDCPELQDWLLAQRERLLGVQRSARLTLIRASEAQGDRHGALGHAEYLLQLDPVSEVAYRLLMTLHHALGDRGAALRAYERCQMMLARELGVTPMPETASLAAHISSDGPSSNGISSNGNSTGGPLRLPPVALASPPGWVRQPLPLVGRSAVWSELEAGWAAGQTLYISGAAGTGKTRLAQDFLNSKVLGSAAAGSAAMGSATRLKVIPNRPGDAGLPYVSLARTFRQLMAEHPGLPLPAWVRAELARLLPELGVSPLPVLTLADKLRFYEAQAQVLVLSLDTDQGETLLLLDDLQFGDDLSWEAWNYILAHPGVTGRVRVVFTCRRGELSPAREAAVCRAAETGQGRVVNLEALSSKEVESLLAAADPGAPTALGADLARYTGGNPLFVIETLRGLHDAGVLARGWPQRLPQLPGLRAMLARRLESLSGPALRVVRAAAVAGTEFSPALAARVLEVHPLDLTQAWAELTSAQVLVAQGVGGAAFSHDLLAQAALDALPAPILALLHARTAQVLQDGVAEPASIARHWAQAGDTVQAAPWWVRAGWACHARGASEEAALAFRRALEGGLSVSGDLEARHGLGLTLTDADPVQAEQALMLNVTLARQAGASPQAMTSQAALAELYRKQGRLDAGMQTILEALSSVPPGTTAADAAAGEVSGLWQTRFWLELRSGHLQGAETAITQAIRLAPQHFWLENERALLLWHTGRIRDTALVFETLMRRLAPEWEYQLEALAGLKGNMAWTYWMLGRNAEAATLLEQVLTLPAPPYLQGLARSNLATVLTSQGRYREALTHLALARSLMAPYDLPLADVLHRLSVIHYRADHFGQALRPLLEALPLARQVADPYRLSYILASLAATQAHLGELDSAQAHAAEAAAIAERIHFPLTLVIAAQAASVVFRLSGDAAGATRHALAAAAVARACDMPEQLGQALLLTAGPPESGLRANLEHSAPVRLALEEALNLGLAHDLPDLIWRAASALIHRAPAEVLVVSSATQAQETLRLQSPPGWFPTR
jgi:DNA-binding SARP family transcriptional activator/tetratricopeptide (TPR) repeat protein